MEFYECGNDFYRSHDYQSAIAQYTLSLSHQPTSELKKKLLLNRAQSYLNERDYTAAIHDCTTILETLDDACPKALIRRALAYENCGNYRRGLVDIEKATTLPGTELSGSLADTAMKLKTRLHGLAKADEIAVIKEGRPDRMIHVHQTLRLNLNAEIPTEVHVEQSFVVHLCIGNEFGLWDRSNMQGSTDAGDIPVKAQVSLTRTLIDGDGTDAFTLSVVQQTTTAGGGEDIVGLDGKVSMRLAFSFNHTDDSNTSTHNISSSTKALPTEAIAVLKFSLNRCLPSGVEVVPVLTLPIRVKTCPSLDSNSRFNGHPPDNQRADNHQFFNHDSNGRHLIPHNPSLPTATTHHDLVHIGLSTQSSCIRECKIGLHEETLPSIFVLESPGSLGIGGKVWDSTYVLVEYLHSAEGRSYVTGRKMVELGSGTGIAGLSLSSRCPAHIILTDLPEIVPLLNANIKLNSLLQQNQPIAQQQTYHDRYCAQALKWGDEISRGMDNNPCPLDCEVVIASDVVYDPAGYEPLVDTLCALLARTTTTTATTTTETTTASLPAATFSTTASSDFPPPFPHSSSDHHPTTKICILAHRHRHPENQRFFDSLRARPGMCVELIHRQSQHRKGEDEDRDGVVEGGKSDVSSSSSSSSSVLQDVELYKIYFFATIDNDEHNDEPS